MMVIIISRLLILRIFMCEIFTFFAFSFIFMHRRLLLVFGFLLYFMITIHHFILHRCKVCINFNHQLIGYNICFMVLFVCYLLLIYFSYFVIFFYYFVFI